VVKLIGFSLVNGLLPGELIQQPTYQAVVIKGEEMTALGPLYQRPQVPKDLGVH